MIGDHDPEDAYDASDPPFVRLAILSQVAKSLDLEGDADRRTVRLAGLVRLLEAIVRDLRDG